VNWLFVFVESINNLVTFTYVLNVHVGKKRYKSIDIPIMIRSKK